jgi:hypothetical protein
MVSRENEVVFGCVIIGAVAAFWLADSGAPAGVPAGAFALVGAVVPMAINNRLDAASAE